MTNARVQTVLLGHVEEITEKIIEHCEWQDLVTVANLNKQTRKLILARTQPRELILCFGHLHKLYKLSQVTRTFKFCVYSKIATRVVICEGDSQFRAKAEYLGTLLEIFDCMTYLRLSFELPLNKYGAFARTIAVRKPNINMEVNWDTCGAWKSALQNILIKHNVTLTSTWQMVTIFAFKFTYSA
jgi:hypothetical protein